MSNMECCTLTIHDRRSLKSFSGDSAKREAWWFCIFLRQTNKKGGSIFFEGEGEGLWPPQKICYGSSFITSPF